MRDEKGSHVATGPYFWPTLICDFKIELEGRAAAARLTAAFCFPTGLRRRLRFLCGIGSVESKSLSKSSVRINAASVIKLSAET